MANLAGVLQFALSIFYCSVSRSFIEPFKKGIKMGGWGVPREFVSQDNWGSWGEAGRYLVGNDPQTLTS